MKCVNCECNLGSSGGRYDLRAQGWVCKNVQACNERQMDAAFIESQQKEATDAKSDG